MQVAHGIEIIYSPHPLNPPLLKERGEKLFWKGLRPFHLPYKQAQNNEDALNATSIIAPNRKRGIGEAQSPKYDSRVGGWEE